MYQSINLTILPGAVKTPATKGAAEQPPPKPEYSSREVKPAALLLRDLLRAHSIFLLHHASSLNVFHGQTRRSKFVSVLGHYWDSFLSTWNVLMHGNPANDLYGGIKIAACGELGVGVGEEERGSGEREVLEGFVGRVDGLVDVMVSKFGTADPPREPEKNLLDKEAQRRARPTDPWLGSEDDPAAEDGAIFLGTGALSRTSLRDVSHWVEDLYRWGSQAYGVHDNATSTRRTREPKVKSRPKHAPTQKVVSRKETRESSPMNTIPPAPVDEQDPSSNPSSTDPGQSDVDSVGNKFVQYLKLGYGTHWSVAATSIKDEVPIGVPASLIPLGSPGEDSSKNPDANNPASTASQPKSSTDIIDDSLGHYIIGLLGDLEDETGTDDEIGNSPNSSPESLSSGHYNHNSRLLLRTLTVGLENEDEFQPEKDISRTLSVPGNNVALPSAMESGDLNRTRKLRVVVYVNKPFIFVLLFDLETQSLTNSSLYRSLHHQIGPLIKPLLSSTSFRASKPIIAVNGRGDTVTPIYDLVWDPKLLTVTSTIPNIPDPYLAYSKPRQQLPWSRIEALNTHMQILNTHITTSEGVEKERTCKTSRGWWVVWTRVPDPESQTALRPSRGTSRRTSISESEQGPPKESKRTGKEIFLIRRASDNVGGTRLSSRLVSGASGSGDAGWIGGPGKLAQGIGIDTKRYIESLLNLNG